MVELKCVADGVPIPTIKWTKPGDLALKQETSSTSTVSVELKSEADFGQYKCSAANGFPPSDVLIINLVQISKLSFKGSLRHLSLYRMHNL